DVLQSTPLISKSLPIHIAPNGNLLLLSQIARNQKMREELFSSSGGTNKFFGTLIPFFGSFISFFRSFVSVLRGEFSFAPWRFSISSGAIEFEDGLNV
ncbi:hypothetical protein, partial [Porphyromonas sp.]|uniref:hypothetical protein n=1 Tax=Porphyromonas sp. TaxID=1924944 RepID=UPI003AB12B63